MVGGGVCAGGAARRGQGAASLTKPRPRKQAWHAIDGVVSVAAVDPVSAAISKMAALDPQQLEVAESHPVVLKTLTAALTPPPEAA